MIWKQISTENRYADFVIYPLEAAGNSAVKSLVNWLNNIKDNEVDDAKRLNQYCGKVSK